jgi:hypothetical protein
LETSLNRAACKREYSWQKLWTIVICCAKSWTCYLVGFWLMTTNRWKRCYVTRSSLPMDVISTTTNSQFDWSFWLLLTHHLNCVTELELRIWSWILHFRYFLPVIIGNSFTSFRCICGKVVAWFEEPLLCDLNSKPVLALIWVSISVYPRCVGIFSYLYSYAMP